jgi:hypothetical protein
MDRGEKKETMSQEQTFWSVECGSEDPQFLVCMSCLNEVFRCKVPMPDCPTCHGVSTYEAFTLESIRDWGTEELIAKADTASKFEALPEEPSLAEKEP